MKKTLVFNIEPQTGFKGISPHLKYLCWFKECHPDIIKSIRNKAHILDDVFLKTYGFRIRSWDCIENRIASHSYFFICGEYTDKQNLKVEISNKDYYNVCKALIDCSRLFIKEFLDAEFMEVLQTRNSLTITFVC